MSNEHKIRITTTTDTSGAKEAERALESLEDQARQTADATANAVQPNTPAAGVSGQLSGTINPEDIAATERAAEAQRKLTEASAEYNRTIPKAIEQTQEITTATTQKARANDDAATAIGKTNQILSAVVIAQAAGALSAAGAGLQQFAAGLRDTQPETAKTLEGIGGLASGLGDVANYTSQGAAIAGPYGAAIGAAIGVASAALKPFIEDMKEQLRLADESAEAAVKMGEKYKEAAAAFASDQIKQATQDINELTGAQLGLNNALSADLAIQQQREEGQRAAKLQAIAQEEEAAKLALAQGKITAQQLADQLEILADQRLLAKEESAAAREQARVKEAELKLQKEQNLLEAVKTEIAAQERKQAELEAKYAEQRQAAEVAKGIAANAESEKNAARDRSIATGLIGGGVGAIIGATRDLPPEYDQKIVSTSLRANQADADASTTSAAIGEIQNQIKSLQAKVPDIENTIGLAAQNLSIVQVTVDEGLKQIAAATKSEQIQEATKNLTDATDAQSQKATDALNQAKAGIEQEIKDYMKDKLGITTGTATFAGDFWWVWRKTINGAVQPKPDWLLAVLAAGGFIEADGWFNLTQTVGAFYGPHPDYDTTLLIHYAAQFTATAINRSLPTLTNFRDPGDYPSTPPPGNLASSLLSVQSFTPYRGRVALTPWEDYARDLGAKLNFPGATPRIANVGALVQEEEIQLQTGIRELTIGQPSRTGLLSLMSRFRKTSAK